MSKDLSQFNETKELLSLDSLKRACELLSGAERIGIIANDTNSCIAEYAKHNLYFVGKLATVYHNVDSMLYLSMLAERGTDAVIVMTKYGLSRHINTAAEVLNKRDVPTIAFLSERDESTGRLFDVVFRCSYNGELQRLGDLAYNISTKYLFDLIFACMFAGDYKTTVRLEKVNKELYYRGV